MVYSRLRALPRLSRRALKQLLDQRVFMTRYDRRPIVWHGQDLGYVEATTWYADRVDISGWVRSGHISVGFANRAHQVIPDGDTIGKRLSFRTSIPRPSPRESLEIGLADTGPIVGLRPPPRPAEAILRLFQLPIALGFAARHAGDILRYLMTSDPGLSVALREAFGFGADPETAPLLPDDLFAEAPIPKTPSDCTIILIPVYNAFENLRALLSRLRGGLDIEHHILLIDDGSDDPRVAPLLEAFCQEDPARTTLDRQFRNEGFVATVNRGLARAAALGKHVIILNTDTLPPDGWAGRLIAPILDDDTIASVTPLSNNAEIASIPSQGTQTVLTDAAVDRIDSVARRFGPRWRQTALPTGIGFAMAINRRFLDLVGHFDATFGRGYGEEVDWCQRARAAGGRHVLATSVFVGHEGGASFGSSEKQARVASAGRIISQRYPRYDAEVQDWAEDAPHAIQRAALCAAWLDAVSERPVPVFLGHVLGGGAEESLRREIDAELKSGTPGIVVVRVGGTAAWRIDIEGRDFRHSVRAAEIDRLMEFLAPLQQRRIIYSCGVGARDPSAVPDVLLQLSADADTTLELRLHDYFPISPSYCLLDSTGTYRGAPLPGNTDPAHRVESHVAGHALTFEEWRDRWSAVIRHCEKIVAFSNSSANLLAEAYPSASGKIEVRPHSLPPDMPRKIDTGGANIGVLGGINQAKGAEIVVGLARHLSRSRGGPRIVIVGELDPNYRLDKPHMALGRYKRADISALAERHGIGAWLIPSIWPETFSFTTREALATGLPVFTFDLGAQAEAVRAARNGHLLDCQPGDISGILNRIRAQMVS